jgi:hypothetical protein
MKSTLKLKPSKNEKAFLKKLIKGEAIYVSMFIKGRQKYANTTPNERKACKSIIDSCSKLLTFIKGAGTAGHYILNEDGKKTFADLTKKEFTFSYTF